VASKALSGRAESRQQQLLFFSGVSLLLPALPVLVTHALPMAITYLWLVGALFAVSVALAWRLWRRETQARTASTITARTAVPLKVLRFDSPEPEPVYVDAAVECMAFPTGGCGGSSEGGVAVAVAEAPTLEDRLQLYFLARITLFLLWVALQMGTHYAVLLYGGKNYVSVFVDEFNWRNTWCYYNSVMTQFRTALSFISIIL
jgi:hypothetical protein